MNIGLFTSYIFKRDYNLYPRKVYTLNYKYTYSKIEIKLIWYYFEKILDQLIYHGYVYGLNYYQSHNISIYLSFFFV